MTTRIAHRAFSGAIVIILLGIVGALLLLSRPASTESLNRPELVDRALRLCHRIPDDDCRDLGPEMLYRPVRNEGVPVGCEPRRRLT